MQEVTLYNSADKKSSLENKPLVSVIIPTRNHLEKIKKALESVAKQTYNNYEIIVTDDASSDGTSDWIKTSYPHIRLIRLPKQGGAAKARNEALKISRGELIAFLDSDDEWLPEYLQFQVEALAQPNSIMSFCEVMSVDADGIKNKIGYTHKDVYPALIHRLLIETSFIFSMSAVVVKADSLKKTGFLNERLKITHDRELYIRLLQLGGNITHIPRALIVKHSHKSNISLNFCNWAKDAMLLLDIFFSDKKNKQYSQAEERARREIILALYSHLSHNNLSLKSKLRISLMLLIYTVRFGKCVRKDIWKILTKK